MYMRMYMRMHVLHLCIVYGLWFMVKGQVRSEPLTLDTGQWTVVAAGGYQIILFIGPEIDIHSRRYT